MLITDKVFSQLLSPYTTENSTLENIPPLTPENCRYKNKSILRWAIYLDAPILFDRLCEVAPFLINMRDNDGYTPLSDSIFYNNVKTLEILLKHKADFALGWDKKSALYWALLYGSDPALCFLFDAVKVEIDPDSQRIINLLHRGISKTSIIVSELSQNGRVYE